MKKGLIISIIAIVLAGSLFAGGIYVGAATTGAGSQNDPVVSLSYLEYRLEKLSGGAGAGQGYHTVSLERGERLMPGAGSTVILYSGSCTAVGTKGIINLTDGSLYNESYTVPMYNVFLVPDDTSGIVAGDNSIVFVNN